ncbi:histidine kinase [Terriglobus roseus DSM 18391]|uniref:histidine kinase n=2 Tax=Terriglobus roseus TaxID=392734 RepID=I3ZGE1_TERRK|nr:histidine kinase [Terriglobus roseus DSM 18391]AFL88650.1 histidine kinase [Terriglobus roseus DSM 18391]
MPLGRRRNKLSYERRLRLWITFSSLPALLTVTTWCFHQQFNWPLLTTCLSVAFGAWLFVTSFFFESMTRPLQTLSNIVSSLREEDYTFRARGARRGDSMGDLALEINALASTLQRQRNSALDALALVDSVISSMPAPLLAFDASGRLRLLNNAAERALHLHPRSALGQDASQLKLSALTGLRDGEVYAPEDDGRTALEGSPVRWSVRRSTFRLQGVPHTLFVLSDVAAALREEERLAWQRLIRVLGHEINNSLTPIKSIASMLRSRPIPFGNSNHTTQDLYEFQRGLVVIEDRADSLNRFLQAYQQLSRLPQPRMTEVDLMTLVEQTTPLETRAAVRVLPSPDIVIQGDPDQLQQVLINLLKNAAEASIHTEAADDAAFIDLSWTIDGASLSLHIVDNGAGLANPENLFVPFYTTKEHGTGTGLTLSRQIIAAHGGALSLRNRQDSTGCIAEISLPIQARSDNNEVF